MRQQIKHILAILLFVLGTASLQAQSVDVQLVYNNTADVNESISNLVKVDELKEAIQANEHIDQNLIVRIAFFDKNAVGRMMLNSEHKLSIDDYVSKWQKMVENKNAVLFLFVKAFEKDEDSYDFDKMYISATLGSYILPSVTELINKQLTENDSEIIISKGTHYLADAIKLISTEEKMAQATELTPFEIKICREYIKTLKDNVAKQEALYLELQKKVPYHSQRDNDPTYKNKTKEEMVKTKKERQDEADAMCNVTSLAMAFEMLGVSKEDAIEKLKEDFDTNDINNIADKDFEDIIDFIRAKKAFTYTYTDKNNKTVEAEALNRTDAILWKLVANYLGISTEGAEEVNSSDINSNKWKIHKPIIEKALKEGDGVVLSLFRTKGHIVRLQSISNEGIVIDDPFGKLTSMAKRELPLDDPKGNYTSNDVDMTKKEGQRGSDVELRWDEINVGVDDSGCGGNESMDGESTAYTTIVGDKTIIHTVIEWANEISPCEYKIVEKEKTNEEKEKINEEEEKINEEGETYQSKIVKCYGGMIKFYLIFKKQ